MSHDARDLSRMLASNVPALVRELLPNGHREGAEWVHPSLSGTSRRSLSVRMTGTKSGVWSDFSSGEAGDALGLVSMVMCQGDLRAAIAWARSYLGLSADAAPGTTKRREAPPPPEQKEQSGPDVEGRRRAARAIFFSAREAIVDTPVAAYLAARGIDLNELGRAPRSLRFHPALSNQESGRNWPAMVAAVTSDAGEMVAVHRTWLYRDRSGRWAKAPLQNPKMSLAPLEGGTIRLWRGASRRPLAQAREGEAVVIAEGIETALSCAVLCPELRVLSAVSLPNMARVELPGMVRTVIIAADDDGHNLAAARGLQRAVDHFIGQGRTARIARCPVGKDFNDLLKADVEWH